MHVAPLTGPELAAAMGDLAQLRIEVFRAYPYLYDGTAEYEAKYLATFANARDAVIVAAWDGGRIVGCATGSSLEDHHAEFAAPLAKAGVPVEGTFYCGESVLRPDYRGRGIGHAFFDRREAHAKAHGYVRSCFCAVVRHGPKPEGYTPLDAFWRARGYRPVDGALAQFGWKDLGETAETVKPMQVWLREF